MPANLRISAQFPFPSGVAGTTPIAVTKANGIWSVALPLDALATQNPSGGSLTTDYLLVLDSLTGTYFKMPISNVPTGPPGPPGAAGPPGPSGGITDAPSDGVNYGRKNAAWNNLDTLYAPIAAAAPLDALAYNGMQINGSMEVSQEKGTSGTTVNGGYPCDNWRLYLVGTMAVTAAQTTNIAPGFARSLGVSVQTPEVSLGASDAAQIYQSIEGYRVARLAWGTANAQPITLGFWTMHHRPGLYSGAITNSAGNRCYAFTYTQSAADVAQYNVATIPGDTAGIWATDNTIGMNVIFALAAGSSATAPSANTWLAGSYAAAPGQVNAVAATSDAFRITGVVVLPGIEAPSSARSALIMRPFDQELVMCQRYWRKQITFAIAGYGLAASASGAYLPFSPVMRATPTLSQSGAGVLNAGPLTANSTNQTGFWLQTVVTATGAFYSFSDLSLDARL